MDGNGSGLTSVDYRTGERAAKGVLLVVRTAPASAKPPF